MKEIWKDIPEYEGHYQVSEYGKVKSIPRLSSGTNGYGNRIEERILKHDMIRGYESYRLMRNSKSKRFLCHQLVAMAFLNHKPNGHKLVVDHIDNDPLNNHYSNLQLITQRENSSKDRYRHNTSSKYLGVCYVKREDKWTSKITIKGKNFHLGDFKDELDASKAYQKALKIVKLCQ